MVEHHPRLSSSEISGLWQSYHEETMALCLLKYFLHHTQDSDIKLILEKSKKIRIEHIARIRELFIQEQIPIPTGFTDEDVDFSAPPLFYDTFGLSYVYMLARIDLINIAFISGNVVRRDVLTFFKQGLKDASDIYEDATYIMLAKGLYDRPPMIPYPKKKEYIQSLKYLKNERPVNALELGEIFFNIERNYFSILICTALAQVTHDKEIKEFIIEGKELSEKQIKFFNGVLLNEELLGTVPTQMEVTPSKTSPFSEKLVMGLFTALNSIDLTLIGHGMSLFMRGDLQYNSGKFLTAILAYMTKGFNLMVKRKWIEQPPQNADREQLEKG